MESKPSLLLAPKAWKDISAPKFPSAAPPDSWLKNTIPAAMKSLLLWDSAAGSKNVALSASISTSGNLFAYLNY